MANLQVRVDDNLKDDADKLFNQLGINTNDAIRIFLTRSVREQALPFDMSLNNKPTKELQASINEAYEKMDGKLESKLYENIDDIMAALND